MAIGVAPLDEGDCRHDHRYDRRRCEDADEEAAPSRTRDAIAIDLIAACFEELTLVVTQLEARFVGPRLGQLQSAATVEEAGIGLGLDPVVRC